MKSKLLLSGMVLFTIGTFTSCKKENITPVATTKNHPSVEAIQKAGVEKTTATITLFRGTMVVMGGLMGNVNVYKKDNAELSCAVVTRDTTVYPYAITVDYGSGCTLNSGAVVSGKVTGTATSGDWTTPGTSATFNCDSLFIDNVNIAGTLTINVLGANSSGNYTYSLDMSNSQVKYGSDGYQIKQNIHWQIEWLANGTQDPTDDHFSVTGGSDGVTSNGDTYTESITTPLIISRDANCVRQFIEGTTLSHITSNPDMVIDYGNGTCDNFADVTQNGTTTRIRLKSF